MNRILFNGCELVLFFQFYTNDRLCITLIEANTGEEYCVATINIPEEKLEAGEVIIKDYSETAGVFNALVEAGVILSTGKSVNGNPIGLINREHSIPIGFSSKITKRDRDSLKYALKVSLNEIY